LNSTLNARRIVVIIGIGVFLISSELLAFRSLKQSVDGFAQAVGTVAQRAAGFLGFVSALSKLTTGTSDADSHFQWDWKRREGLNAEQSLRKAEVTDKQREAIAQQIRPLLADLGVEFESESELRKDALDTRVKMIDLNGDGVPEIVAQGMIGCGATGNCPFWVFRKMKQGYGLILNGQAQTFTIQKPGSGGFADLVLSRHGSSSSGDLLRYQFRGGAYQVVGCYVYEWTVPDGENIRELKEPRIAPCN
jgi:hypothetical protein